MKILLTGAAGAVGSNLGRFLSAAGHTIVPVDILTDTRFPDLITADLAKNGVAESLLEAHAPDAVCHLAAKTDIADCERDPHSSHVANFRATAVLAKACGTQSIRLVYLSTDYVFGAEDRLWRTTHRPCPNTQYGRDKAAAEAAIQAELDDFAIVRSAQIYGLDGDFVQLVSQSLRARKPFQAFSNLINCPTWTGDLFPMLGKILLDQHQGIFHCVGPEALSRYQFAHLIGDSLSLDCNRIEPKSLDFSRDIRPPVVRLDGRETYEALGISPGTVKENLSKSCR